MKTYKIEYTFSASQDLYNLTYTIVNTYKSPLTAKKYINGLIDEINKLKYSCLAIPFCCQQSITDKFGLGSKRINYKKMAVVFTIVSDTVVIEAIVPQANVKGL
ncbi:hypothetical protein JZU68_01730 [bacterium]|nr:hypothetical protein [bacterium]